MVLFLYMLVWTWAGKKCTYTGPVQFGPVQHQSKASFRPALSLVCVWACQHQCQASQLPSVPVCLPVLVLAPVDLSSAQYSVLPGSAMSNEKCQFSGLIQMTPKIFGTYNQFCTGAPWRYPENLEVIVHPFPSYNQADEWKYAQHTLLLMYT